MMLGFCFGHEFSDATGTEKRLRWETFAAHEITVKLNIAATQQLPENLA